MKKMLMVVVLVAVAIPLYAWGQITVKVHSGQPFPTCYGPGTVYVDSINGNPIGIQGRGQVHPYYGQNGQGYGHAGYHRNSYQGGGYQNGCQGYGGGYQGCQGNSQGYGGYQDYQNQGCQEGYGDNEKIYSRERWDTRGGERHFEKVPSIGGKIVDAIKTIGAFAIIYR